jgi:hypothetical protein
VKNARPQAENAREGDSSPMSSPSPTSPSLPPSPSLRTAWICVNGILTNPGDAEGWTDRAVTWLNLHTAGKAEKFEYAAGALTRRLRQAWRAEAIARMASFYIRGGYDVVLIGHSNGADLIERVLPLLWPATVKSVHLFAPACDGHALAHALIEGAQLGTLHLYGSANDRALRVAHLSQKLFGWLGLGYGDLGLNVDEFAGRTPNAYAHRDDRQNHSSWFERGESFERTMRQIIANESATLHA